MTQGTAFARQVTEALWTYWYLKAFLLEDLIALCDRRSQVILSHRLSILSIFSASRGSRQGSGEKLKWKQHLWLKEKTTFAICCQDYTRHIDRQTKAAHSFRGRYNEKGRKKGLK